MASTRSSGLISIVAREHSIFFTSLQMYTTSTSRLLSDPASEATAKASSYVEDVKYQHLGKLWSSIIPVSCLLHLTTSFTLSSFDANIFPWSAISTCYSDSGSLIILSISELQRFEELKGAVSCEADSKDASVSNEDEKNINDGMIKSSFHEKELYRNINEDIIYMLNSLVTIFTNVGTLPSAKREEHLKFVSSLSTSISSLHNHIKGKANSLQFDEIRKLLKLLKWKLESGDVVRGSKND